MELRTFASRILFSESLGEKLAAPDSAIRDEAPGAPLGLTPEQPARAEGLAFRRREEDPGAPPREAHLGDEEQLGRLLHFFANHELLAVELMALVLLKFPDAPAAFRRGVYQTLREEQAHTQLYLSRMEACGVRFGDLPVSGFFWQTVAPMVEPIDYVTRLSLTFEQANLDYSRHYAAVMRRVGDEATAAILDRVYRDEISHVRYGLEWFRRWKSADESDWEAYAARLERPLSPSRAKAGAPEFNRQGRLEAGLDEDFVSRLRVYEQSKGRTPRVFWFCPTVDLEIADEVEGTSRPATPLLRGMARDLEPLLLLLARRDDVALFREPPSQPHLERLLAAGFDLPECLPLASGEGGEGAWQVPAGLADRKLAELRPWAWGPGSDALLAPLRRQLTRPERALQWNPALRVLFSKVFWVEQIQGRVDVDETRICRSWEEVEAARAELGAELVVKLPHAASARGNRRLSGKGEVTNSLRCFIEQGLAGQGVVLVERWRQRVFEFSTQFEMEEGGLRNLGQVRLLNRDAGTFVATEAGPKFTVGLPAELARLLAEARGGVFAEGSPLLECVERCLTAAGYRGPVGLDSFVHRLENGELALRVCCEINPRYTMGRVALELQRRIAAGHWARFEIESPGRGSHRTVDDTGGLSLDSRGRLCAGRVPLHANGARWQAWLEVLREPLIRGGSPL